MNSLSAKWCHAEGITAETPQRDFQPDWQISERQSTLPKSQIVGGPGWLDSAMYDIDAKSSPEVDARLKAVPDGDAARQKRLMVRELLKERFSLTTHEETRVLPVYNLVLARGGAKFQPSDHSGTRIDAGRSRIHVQGSDDTIGLLARELAQSQGRVVVNKTGLTGPLGSDSPLDA